MRLIVGNHRLWARMQSRGPSEFASRQRYFVIQKRIQRKCRDLVRQPRVLAGPFAGLRYSAAAAVGSSLWPKLLGTYESELHWVVEKIAQTRYQKIFDIGYAEGFYLVGLGTQQPQAQLIGYDISPDAETLCRANAAENSIDDSRLSLRGEFDHEQFSGEVGEGTLVVVDCEGFEDDVLRSVDADSIRGADWLIEMHDHVVEGTTERWAEALEPTHQVIRIVSDTALERKRELLPESIRQRCDRFEQEALVNEGRETQQSWVYAVRNAA